MASESDGDGGGAAALLRAAMAEPNDRLKGRKRMDAEIERWMAYRLVTLALSAPAVFRLARKHARVSGRGAVVWFFRSVEHLAARSKTPDGSPEADPPLTFGDKEKVRGTECAQLVQFVDQYDPTGSFAVVVAVKTGDRRDALFRPMVFGRSAHLDPVLSKSGLPLPPLRMRVPSNALHVYDSEKGDTKLCETPMCSQMEAEPGKFQACGRCRDAYYCDVECQKSDWKVHKRQTCVAAAPAAKKKE